MGRKCFVPNCKANYDSTGKECKFSTFAPPSDPILFEQWEKAIGRKDLPLNPKSCICERHFLPSDIVKEDTLIIHGEKVLIPKLRPHLKKGAIPCLWPDWKEFKTGCKGSRTNSAPKTITVVSTPIKTQSSKDEASTSHGTQCKVTRVSPAEGSTNGKNSNQKSSTVDTPTTVTVVQLTKEDSVHLPAHWSEMKPKFANDEQCYYAEILKDSEDHFCYVRKSLRLNLTERRGYLYVNSKKVSVDEQDFVELDSAEKVSEFLSRFDRMEICPGIPRAQCPNIETAETGELKDDVWRSKKCQIISDTLKHKVCENCIRLRNSLRIREKRERNLNSKMYDLRSCLMNVKDLRRLYGNTKNENRNLQRQVIRLSRRLVDIRRELKDLKKEANTNDAEAIKEFLETLHTRE